MARGPFLVASELVDLAITVAGGAVTTIRLHAPPARPPETPLERQVAAELGEYLAGGRSRFTFPVSPSGTDFERGVWSALQQIPYGQTRTYGEIAASLGTPRGARAVGSANHKNPIPIVIPCHRVVAANGGLGGYGGGLGLKRKLLNLESRALQAPMAPAPKP